MSNGKAGEHRHVSVFAGVEERFVPGLVVYPSGQAWTVEDVYGELAGAERCYGPFASEKAACHEALRLLRSRYGPPLRVCWGAGAPNEALRALGYQRGSVHWRWWPPGYFLSGASEVGPDGGPVPAKAASIRWGRLGSTVSIAINDVEGLTAFSHPPGAARAHRKLFVRYAKDVVLRGGRSRWRQKPVAEAQELSPAWFHHLRLVVSLLVWVLERAPEVGPIRSLRFVNPGSGASFIDEDTGPVEGSVIEGAIRRLVGNKMENGVLLVNERLRLPFSCDCLGKVVLFVTLPSPAKWLVPEEVERQVGALSRQLRVPVDLSIALGGADLSP